MRQQQVFQSRGTGKTLRMVQNMLPNSLVIIPNPQFRAYISDMIARERGPEFLQTLRFASIQNLEERDFRGLSCPVAVDHGVWSVQGALRGFYCLGELLRYSARHGQPVQKGQDDE